MKLKAVVPQGNQLLLDALNSVSLRDRVWDLVLREHLNVKAVGPATHYMQVCDEVVGPELMCEVSLSRVSVTDDRSTNDFYRARQAIEDIYAEVIKPLLKPDERLQLMVSIILDKPPLHRSTSLIEGEGNGAVWVKANKKKEPYHRTGGN